MVQVKIGDMKKFGIIIEYAVYLLLLEGLVMAMAYKYDLSYGIVISMSFILGAMWCFFLLNKYE